MTTGAAKRAILTTFESEIEPQIRSALNKVSEGREEIIGIVHTVKELLVDLDISSSLESDELDLIESLQQDIADLTSDSLQWVYFEITGQRMSGDALQKNEPDDSASYDRAAFRRFIAEGVEGVKAVHRAYQFALLRTADPSGLAYYREQLATGGLTYWTLVERLLSSPEHQRRFAAPNQSQPATPAEPTTILRGNFIRNDAHESTHYLMSDLITVADRAAVMERELAEGANAISLMPWYECDYHGAHFPVNFQRGDEIFWLPELMRMTERGLTPIIWMMTDDAMPHLNRADIDEVIARWEEFITLIVEPLQLRYLIIGLEALEYWTDSALCRRLGNFLKARCPWADIGFHTLPGDERLLDEDFFHTIHYQYSEQERVSPQRIAEATQRIIQHYGKPVVASEYTLSGESEAGKCLGDAALQAGAVGALNGCHAKGAVRS